MGMGALTEREIFDCLFTNFGEAAKLCDDLAVLPAKGPSYDKLRKTLALIEGAARQAAYWRQDARWLTIAAFVAEAHKRAGNWLRGAKRPDGVKVMLRPGELHPLFKKLAENLRAGQRRAEEFRDKKTGRMGTILPRPLPGPHRDHRPVSVVLPNYHTTPSGLILPN